MMDMRIWAVIALVCAVAGCTFDTSGNVSLDADPSATADAARSDAMDVTLVDRGLVSRYFLDENASGQSAQFVIDSAGNPANIQITYGQASFVEDAGGRGLAWPSAQGSGKLQIGLDHPKLSSRLRNADVVTIEVVVDIDDAGGQGSDNESQIAGMRGGNPDFMLVAIGRNDIAFRRPFGQTGATWNGVNAGQRMTLHLVFDPTQSDPDARLQLYKDGVVAAKSSSDPPPMGTGVMLSTGDDLLIGNDQGENQSIAGAIYYVAFYDLALDTAEIATNAQRLLANDDE